MLWMSLKSQTRNQRWLVVGADQEPGTAIALALAAAGQQVVAQGQSLRNLQNILRMIRSPGGHAEEICLPLNTTTDGEELVAEAKKGGPIHGVCFVTEHSEQLLFEKTSQNKLAHQFGAMLAGPAGCLLAALPELQRQHGQIIAVCSLAAVMPYPGRAAYAGSQSGWYGLLRSVRCEVREQQVPVSVIVPGLEIVARSMPARPRLSLTHSPQAIAQQVVRISRQPQDLTIMGWPQKLGHLVNRLAPQTFERSLQKLAPLTIPGYAQAKLSRQLRLIDQLIVKWRGDQGPERILKE